MIPPAGLSQVTRYETISDGHCTRQTKFALVPSGSIQTPPHPCPRRHKTQRSGNALDYLRQETWPGKQVIAESLPMRDISMEGLGEVGPGPGSILGQGLLDVEEVPDGAGH